MKKELLYCITFKTDNEIYRLRCKKITESSYYGFLQAEVFIFQDQRKYVIEPEDEKARREFGGLRRVSIPFHSILRIDEYEETEIYSPFLKLETSGEPVGRQPSSVVAGTKTKKIK